MKTAIKNTTLIVSAFFVMSCTSTHHLSVTNTRKKPVTACYIKNAYIGNTATIKRIRIEERQSRACPIVTGYTIGVDLPLIRLAASEHSVNNAIRFYEQIDRGSKRKWISYKFPKEYCAYLDRWTDMNYFSRILCRSAGSIELRDDGSANMKFEGKSYVLKNTE